MKRLCFGTLFRILHYCSKPGTGQRELGSALMKVFDYNYGETLDEPKASKLYNCAEGLSLVYIVKPAKKIPIENVKKGFASYVLPLIDENKYALIILALRDVIFNDDIKEETMIGTVTKIELRETRVFDFVNIVAGILYYTCINVKNKEGIDYINQITTDYVNSFIILENTISIAKAVIIESDKLNKTISPDTFLEAFHEIDADLSMGLKNNNQLRLFRLACDEGEYSYEALNDFLLDNIGSYVYSREKRKELTDKNKTQSIAYRAMRVMRENGKVGSRDVGNDLAQMLVYAFLEEALGAPKIMSRVEIVRDNGAYKSKSDSIHFLTYEQNGKKVYELVFGAADISMGIKEAIDKAMTIVQSVAHDRKKEKGIISGNLLNRTFDPETTNFLKSILLPSKNNVQTPNMAFGIFVGYSMDVCSNVDLFEEKAADKLEKDVTEMIPYIVQKIDELNLIDRSFYIYFLPFNNAVTDKISIMNNLLMVGGDS